MKKSFVLAGWSLLVLLSVWIFIVNLENIKQTSYEEGYDQAYAKKGRLLKNVTIIMNSRAQHGIYIGEDEDVNAGIIIKDASIIGK